MEVRDSLRKHGVEPLLLHQCMSGTPWKKPTMFLSNLPGGARLAQQCNHPTGYPRSLVGRTGRTFWSQQAQEYPPELCEVLAERFVEAAVANTASQRCPIGMPLAKGARRLDEKVRARAGLLLAAQTALAPHFRGHPAAGGAHQRPRDGPWSRS